MDSVSKTANTAAATQKDGVENTVRKPCLTRPAVFGAAS